MKIRIYRQETWKYFNRTILNDPKKKKKEVHRKKIRLKIEKYTLLVPIIKTCSRLAFHNFLNACTREMCISFVFELITSLIRDSTIIAYRSRLENAITENDSRIKWQSNRCTRSDEWKSQKRRLDLVTVARDFRWSVTHHSIEEIKMLSIRWNCKLPSVIWQTVNVANSVSCRFFFIQYFPFKLLYLVKSRDIFKHSLLNSIDNSTIYAASYIVQFPVQR